MNINSPIFVPKMNPTATTTAPFMPGLIPYHGMPPNMPPMRPPFIPGGHGGPRMLYRPAPSQHHQHHLQYQQQRMFTNRMTCSYNAQQYHHQKQQQQQQQHQHQRKLNNIKTKGTAISAPAVVGETKKNVTPQQQQQQQQQQQLANDKEVSSTNNDDTHQQQQRYGNNNKARNLNTKNDDYCSSNYNNHQQQQQQQQHQQNCGNKSQQQQRNKWRNNKRQYAQQNAGQKHSPATEFNDDWRQKKTVYGYDSHYLSSCGEEHIMARHTHRNSTSSDTAISGDDMNSGNEDMNINQKSTKSRQRQRQQQKRKNQKNIPLDIDDECKENKRPANNNNSVCGGQQHGGNSSSSSNIKAANVNLRKRCTETAALKAAYHKNATPKQRNSTNVNPLTTSASNSSVASSLSTSSSSSSISSSASSSLHTPSSSANSSPTASPTINKRKAQNIKKLVQQNLSVLQSMQNLTEAELVERLSHYIVPRNLLRIIGYPQESTLYAECTEIFKCLPHTDMFQNAGQLINSNDGLTMTPTNTNTDSAASLSCDSGHGSSENSSPPSALDSDACEEMSITVTANEICTQKGNYQIFTQYDNSTEKQCVRCKRTFHVTESGEYVDTEECLSHAGKLQRFYRPGSGINSLWSCCGDEKYSRGCTTNAVHVWNGTVLGINGPYRDYVYTRARCTGDDAIQRPTKIYALDCEMSYTGRGLEATKISVIGFDGKLVYEQFIRPDAEIVDFNTRFSGICEEDLECGKSDVKTLHEVQQDLLELFDAETILVGHALDNDLRSLRMVHHTVVDTSLSFYEPFSGGFPNRRSLKSLTELYLKREIQCSNEGHNSFEDSLASLELILWKVQYDDQNSKLPSSTLPWAAF